MKLYRYNIDNLENKNLNHMYLEERQRAEIEQINLSRQIKQYMIGLEQAMTKLISISNYYRASNNNSSALKQIQLMMKKMEFEIEKYKQTLSRIQNKVMTKGGINNIKSYLSSNYNTLVRECHQLISMCGNKVKQPTSHDFKKIKQFQHEMDEQWNISENRQYKPNNSYSVNMYSKSRISTKQQKQQQSTKDSILKAATAQIQQQFLAIRLIAYKMYEKHNSHHHDKIFNQMQILREEQNKLSKQVNQMKQRRMNLLQEQRRMVAELTEIKKINQLIGRRYFIEGSRVDTNFTTH